MCSSEINHLLSHLSISSSSEEKSDFSNLLKNEKQKLITDKTNYFEFVEQNQLSYLYNEHWELISSLPIDQGVVFYYDTIIE